MPSERWLALETSSPRLSLAVGTSAKILVRYEGPMEWRHAESLFDGMQRLLKKIKWPVQSLTGVAVSIGPGSFTGIRVGLAAARTLGQTLEIPVVGISSLEAMAYGAIGKSPYLCPEIDALQGKIFTALFERTKSGSLKRVIPESHVAPQEWAAKLKARRLKRAPVRVTETPKAADILRLAASRLSKAKSDSYARVLPMYLRAAAAQERRSA